MVDFPGMSRVRDGVVCNTLAHLTVTTNGNAYQLTGAGDSVIASGTKEEIQSAYATAWIRWVAVDGIGLGFHPDTPAEHYTPALPLALDSQYDEMIAFSHEHADPYRDGYQAWQDAGIVPKDDDEVDVPTP